MKRMAVNKSRSAAQFRGSVQHTKRMNVAPRPMRGGFRI